MDFNFTPEQEEFREAVRAFAAAELRTTYLERAKSTEFPRQLLRRMGTFGLTGLGASEAFGGQNADPVTIGIAMEEAAAGDSNAAFLVFYAAAPSMILEQFGSAELRQRWLPGIVAGETILCVAITEPGCGSDAAAMQTRATPCEGGWSIRGEKTSITAANAAAGVIVLTKTNPDAGHRGISSFLLPMSAEGISTQTFTDHGFRPLGRGSIFFDDVVAPRETLVGEEGDAFRMVMKTFDFTRALIGLASVAVARAAIREAVDYAKLRTAFGRPIATFQGVAFPLVEHETVLEAARWLCYRTLWLRQQGLPHTKEAAMCKWWCPKVAVEALHACFLTYGQVAYSEEHPVLQQLRDVMGGEVGDGTANIQKAIIAREMLGRDMVPF